MDDKPKTIKKKTIKKSKPTKKLTNKRWMDWYDSLTPEQKEARLRRRRKGYTPVPVPVPERLPVETISKDEMLTPIFSQDYSGMNDLGSIGEAGPSTSSSSKGGSKRIKSKKRRFSKGRFSKRRSITKN